MAGLNFPIGANITAFDSAMSRVRDIAAKRSADMLGNFQSAAKGIDVAFAGITAVNKIPGALNTITTAAKLAVAGFVAFQVASLVLEGMAAAARAAGEALDGMAKIGEDAARLGISTTFLQTYQAQARSLKVDVDDLTKSLDMAKAAFTVKQGEGGTDARNSSAFEARLRQQMGAGNVTSDQVNQFTGASGLEAQYRAALDIVTELQAKGADLAALDLASKIFPPELVDRIRAGTLDIDKFKKSINDVKNPDLVLLKPEEITRAQELKRRLDEAQATLDAAGREFNTELARAGMGLREDAIAWKELMAGGARAAVSILKQAREYAEQMRNTEPAILGRDVFREEDMPKSGLQKDIGRTETVNPTSDADMNNALNKLRGNLGNRTLIDQAQRASRDMLAPFQKDTTKPIITAPKTKTPTSTTPTETLNQVETYINSLERTTASLKAEAEASGKSNAERTTAINLARAEELAKQNNLTLSEAEIARIKETSAATAEYRDRLEEVREQQAMIRDMGGTVLRGIVSDIRAGVSGMQLLTNAASRFLDKLIEVGEQGLIDSLFGKSGGAGGSGLLGSVFSSLLGGGASLGSGSPDLSVGSDASWLFDTGGYTGPGGKHEPGGIVHKGEIVFSQDDIRRNGGVRNVERMRRATQGYAAGGYVAAGGSVPSPASPSVLKVVPVMPAAPAQKPAPMSGPITIGGTMLSITQPGASIQEIRLLLEDHDRALPAKVRDIQRRAGA
ncbi:hypothetical protein FPV16_23065 [Methylobacterium sp. W2]|nr:hypothetical protein [Methylobacterium sp. W2]